jgi:hypothetical protein
MEPDKTKSVQQPQSPKLNQTNSKTPPTVHVAGISPLPHRVSTDEFDRQPGFWAGLRLPAKRIGTILFLLLILILIGAGLVNLVKGAIDSLTAKKPAAINQPTEQSQPTTTNTPTTASSDKNNCTDLPTRMATAKITSQLVDKVFYQTYPDRVNKPLADTSIDRNLRQEWCAVANKIIEQKSGK